MPGGCGRRAMSSPTSTRWRGASGFDEVEIADDLAPRQPEAQWLARADWQAPSYQSRLRGAALQRPAAAAG